MRKHFLLLFIFAAACSEPDAGSGTENASVSAAESTSINTTPTITQLFDSARSVGELEFQCWTPGPFLYFRSGRFIEDDVTTAVVAQEQNDTTIEIQLWSLHFDIWTLLSETEVFGPGMAFSMNYADYNFDGQTDIYQNVSCSNGYAQRYGNLLLIDPLTSEMKLCREASSLSNMRIDAHRQCIFSSKVIWCRKNGFRDTCVLTNEWISDSLITTSTDCPCEAE